MKRKYGTNSLDNNINFVKNLEQTSIDISKHKYIILNLFSAS